MRSEMNLEEAVEVIEGCKDLDMTKFSLMDNITYIQACVEFAEKIKPLIIKSKLKEKEPSTFLFRMD